MTESSQRADGGEHLHRCRRRGQTSWSAATPSPIPTSVNASVSQEATRFPYGIGRRHGANAPLPVRAILGNWDLQTILTLQDGYPFTVLHHLAALPGPRLQRQPAGRSAHRTAMVRPPPASRPRTPLTVVRADGSRVSTFINGNSAPNVITGPGIVNLDIGVPQADSAHGEQVAAIPF